MDYSGSDFEPLRSRVFLWLEMIRTYGEPLTENVFELFERRSFAGNALAEILWLY